MNYALNLASNGRVLSATFPEFAPANQPRIDALPEGHLSDYVFQNNNLVYSPLPVTPQPPSDEERIAALEEQNALLLECLLEMSELVYA